MISEIKLEPVDQGLHEITAEIVTIVGLSGLQEGLCTIFIRHTSASLIIQENADPAVRKDLENWFARLIPEGDALYTHIREGPDDMPAHIRSTLTATSLCIPILQGALVLGTWQGIFLWEHRYGAEGRQIIVHITS